MPQVTFKGMRVNQVCDISENLKNKLEEIIKCDRKHIKFNIIDSIEIENGKVVESFPRIEMLWFPRNHDIQDKVAEEITRQIQILGYKHVQVTFSIFKPENFYENGKHY